jgi:hypothetical protein
MSDQIIFACAGNAVTNCHVANNIGEAEYVRITNLSAVGTEKLVTVATVTTPAPPAGFGNDNQTFPGTFTLDGQQSVIIRKGRTDTIQIPGDNTTTAHVTPVFVNV